jgi:hypothetical protein
MKDMKITGNWHSYAWSCVYIAYVKYDRTSGTFRICTLRYFPVLHFPPPYFYCPSFTCLAFSAPPNGQELLRTVDGRMFEWVARLSVLNTLFDMNKISKRSFQKLLFDPYACIFLKNFISKRDINFGMAVSKR